VYSGEYYYGKNLSYITAYTRWIARYNSNNGKATTKPSTANVAIWQYSSRGKVAGVSGNVDVNIMYVDLIKSVTGKDYIQAARDVWAGKYGSNDERVAKLKAEGFDPRIVQHFVNRLKA
jgi:GH25 family lysozyme M1 (1,4-beta-N-acetylmuramidase)